MAALSKESDTIPNIAERFELYICGVEVANAFTELTDAKIQRQRFENDMKIKKELYGITYPIDESFIEAIEHMPPATGIALGIERLIMLATGAQDITQVLWSEIPNLQS